MIEFMFFFVLVTFFKEPKKKLKKKMFFFFISLSLSEFQTHHIGKPLHYSKSNDLVALSTSLNEIVLLNETDGTFLWKTPLDDVVSLELREDLEELLVLTKHFYYYVDKETGTITHQLIHNVKKPITASYKDRATVVVGQNSMALYNNTEEIWSTPFDHLKTEAAEKSENSDDDAEKSDDEQIITKDATVHFSEDNQTIILGSLVFDAHTGKKIGKASESDIKAAEKLDFRYEPTVLSYYKNNELAWRIDEPLCGAVPVAIISASQLLLKNDTHLIVFNYLKEKLTKVIPFQFVDFISISGHKSVIRGKGQTYIFHHANHSLTPAEDSHIYTTVSRFSNNTLYQDGFEAHIPSDCEFKCAVQNNNHRTILVASQCGINAHVMLADSPKIHTYYIPNATIHSCLESSDSLYVSYMRTVEKTKRKEILTAFPASPKVGRMLSFYLNSSLAKITKKHSLSFDGTFSSHPNGQISSTVPLEVAVGFGNLFSVEMPPSYQLAYQPSKIACIPNVNTFLDDNDKIVLGGTDIYVLSATQDRSIYITILIVYVLASLYMAFRHYTTKEISFWK